VKELFSATEIYFYLYFLLLLFFKLGKGAGGIITPHIPIGFDKN